MEVDKLLNLRVRSLKQLRLASDAVRGTFIPSITTDPVRLRDAYFEINSTYFRDDAFLGQMMLQNDLAQLAPDAQRDSYYNSVAADFGRLRAERSNVSGFEVLHPRFLELIADRTFSILQSAPLASAGDDLLQRLVVTDFLFQLAHFSKDGSGRCGEDFLVLLGQNSDRPLTFSLTGYRAILGGENRLLFFRHVTERIGQLELVKNFFLWLGLTPPQAIQVHIQKLLETVVSMNAEKRQPRQAWAQDVRLQIDAVLETLMLEERASEPEFSGTHPYRLYALFLAAEAVFLTLCLESPGTHYAALNARYPLSMACRMLDLQDAQSQTYHCIDEASASLADDVVARLDLSRLNFAEGLERDLEGGLAALEKTDPALSALIEVERSTAALEVLLSRVKVPLEPTMTALEVRDAISREMNWAR